MKENKKQHLSPEWGHKILRIVHDEKSIGNAVSIQPKQNVNHIQIDDLQYEYELLNVEGWRYQMGFALDDDSFYLFYNKPINSSK
ncbi:MAG: hypothetical protein KAT14_01640 [Candidatus Marinimicrobia bacterium]|nr:hypothetical protein [Candidatus Neomarinimicrobiota bacterium]